MKFGKFLLNVVLVFRIVNAPMTTITAAAAAATTTTTTITTATATATSYL